MKKQRANRTPSVANRTRSTGTKRKLGDLMEDTSAHTPVTVRSDDEVSEMGIESPAKRLKREVPVREEFVSRFVEKAIGARTVLLGKPVKGSFLEDSGALALFAKLGMSDFLTDLHNDCYPELVKEFYANLHVDAKGKHVSFVSGVKINLNSVILGVIIGVSSAKSVSIYSKKGPVNLEGFSALNQLGILCGNNDVSEFFAPSTGQVLSMAHLLFRICIANICPRMGTKSNFSGQDISVVAMLMASKGFDLCGLFLDNMMEVFTGSNSAGLPYGLLLTKVFEFFGISLDDEEKVSAKDYLDGKGLVQSGLLLDKTGTLIQREPPSPTVKNLPSVSVKPVSDEEFRVFMAEVRETARETRATVKKIAEDSREFHRKLDMVANTLKLQDVTPDQLDAIVKAAAKLLEGDVDISPVATPAPVVTAAPATAVEDADAVEPVES